MDANRGKAILAEVFKLVDDIRHFDTNVREQSIVMKHTTDNLQDAWDDPQYDQFANYMSELIKSLESDLDILQEANDDLERRAKIIAGDY